MLSHNDKATLDNWDARRCEHGSRKIGSLEDPRGTPQTVLARKTPKSANSTHPCRLFFVSTMPRNRSLGLESGKTRVVDVRFFPGLGEGL